MSTGVIMHVQDLSSMLHGLMYLKLSHNVCLMESCILNGLTHDSRHVYQMEWHMTLSMYIEWHMTLGMYIQWSDTWLLATPWGGGVLCNSTQVTAGGGVRGCNVDCQHRWNRSGRVWEGGGSQTNMLEHASETWIQTTFELGFNNITFLTRKNKKNKIHSGKSKPSTLEQTRLR